MSRSPARIAVLLFPAVSLLIACHSGESGTPSPRAPKTALDPDVKRSVDLENGLTLKYREAGDPEGYPVLFLHGVTDTSRSFLPTLRHLERLRPDLRLIAPDLRGHGESSMPPEETCRSEPEECFRFADFANDVISLMDALGIDEAHLVGHSLGSGIAQEVALAAPARVGRMVLIATSGNFGKSPAISEFLLAGLVEGSWRKSLESRGRRWPDDAYGLFPRDADPEAESWMRTNWVADPVADPAFLEEILPETLSVRLGTWIGAVRELGRTDNLARLEELSVPTLVLWPTQDVLFSESDQKALLAALDVAVSRCSTAYYHKVYGRRPLPASGIQEDDLGHNLHWGAPEAVAADLAAFLKPDGEPTRDLVHADPADPRRIVSVPGEAVVVVGRSEDCP